MTVLRKLNIDKKHVPAIRSILAFVMVVAVIGSVILILRYTGLNRPVATSLGIVDKTDLVDVSAKQRTHERAKFMVRESARLVANALEKRNTNRLEAYESAVQASVLVRTAKEMDDDFTQLNKDLGVNFYEYLSYTTAVLQDMRTNLV